MAVELKVPPVGESITEVQIGEWLKNEGEAVRRDEVIVKIETDKVTVDLPAPVSGVISEIRIQNGQPATVGQVIGFLEERAPEAATPKASPTKAEAPNQALPSEAPLSQTRSAEPTRRDVLDSIPPEGFARVMPSARRALQERGLKPEEIEPTGPGGRILKEDVLRHEPDGRAPLPSFSDRHEEVVPMTLFRKRIAERLVTSQQTAALLTTFNEIDMSGVIELRKEYQEAFQEKYGVKLGFMSFFVKAAIEALKLIPAVNAEIRGSDILYKNYYDIGIAVGGGKGLAVPVIRNAERRSFAEVEQTIANFAKRAKENKLELAELQGGTFTISNGGVYGSMLSTPIVNPPQSGILGLHAIQDRPVVIKGQIVVRPIMYVALTYDHRIVDGRESVTFLRQIKQCVEQPARILLEV